MSFRRAMGSEQNSQGMRVSSSGDGDFLLKAGGGGIRDDDGLSNDNEDTWKKKSIILSPILSYSRLDWMLHQVFGSWYTTEKNTDERLTSCVGVSGSRGGIADASSSPSSAAGKSSMRFGRAPADLSQCEVPFSSALSIAAVAAVAPEENGAKSEVLVSHCDPPPPGCCHLVEG